MDGRNGWDGDIIRRAETTESSLCVRESKGMSEPSRDNLKQVWQWTILFRREKAREQGKRLVTEEKCIYFPKGWEARGREGGQRRGTVGDSLHEPHGCPPAHPPAQVHDRHDCLLPRGLKCHRNAELAC